MTSYYTKQVGEFIDAFSLGDKPPSFWVSLTNEESVELLKELCDVVYTISGELLASDDRLESYLKGKLSYCIDIGEDMFGEATFREAFRRVHENNMSKLGPDGKPIYNEDGKVIKPAGYEPVNLEDLVL